MTGLVTEDGLVTDDPTAAGTATGRIRFSLLDELTCCYDRAAEPANVHLEVRLPVRLDQASFRAAVLAALAAHPSFMARRVAAGPWRRSSYWESPQVPDCDPVTTASWADESELACLRAAFLSDSPPLDHSPALRFLLACGPDSDCVILNAHHAVVDGLSCLSLLRAVAGQYGGQADRPPGESRAPGETGPPGESRVRAESRARSEPRAPDVDRDRTGARGQTAARQTAARQAAGGFGAAWRRVRSGPVTRIARRPDPADRGSPPGYGACLLTWNGMPAVADRLRQLGGNVNDLLIAAMMITISRWNDANGSRSGQIRITMPVGDRTAAGAADARGNRSRLTAITARVRPGAGVSELLGEVAPQTRYAKSNPGPQVDLASRVLAAAPLPVIVKRLFLGAVLRVGGPLFCDTSLVSNLGVVEPPQFGPHTATEIWFSTSAHMPRGLSLGVVTVDGALRLTFRYRRALLSDAGADEFAGLYMAALSLLTGEEART